MADNVKEHYENFKSLFEKEDYQRAIKIYKGISGIKKFLTPEEKAYCVYHVEFDKLFKEYCGMKGDGFKTESDFNKLQELLKSTPGLEKLLKSQEKELVNNKFAIYDISA